MVILDKNDNEKTKKSSGKYACELCDYSSSRPNQLERHFNTNKHKNKQKGKNMVTASSKKDQDVFSSKCGKNYKHLSGLSRHKRSCKGDKKDQKLPKTENNTENSFFILFIIFPLYLIKLDLIYFIT